VCEKKSVPRARDAIYSNTRYQNSRGHRKWCRCCGGCSRYDDPRDRSAKTLHAGAAREAARLAARPGRHPRLPRDDQGGPDGEARGAAEEAPGHGGGPRGRAVGARGHRRHGAGRYPREAAWLRRRVRGIGGGSPGSPDDGRRGTHPRGGRYTRSARAERPRRRSHQRRELKLATAAAVLQGDARGSCIHPLARVDVERPVRSPRADPPPALRTRTAGGHALPRPGRVLQPPVAGRRCRSVRTVPRPPAPCGDGPAAVEAAARCRRRHLRRVHGPQVVTAGAAVWLDRNRRGRVQQSARVRLE
jgi:hypothetical protein